MHFLATTILFVAFSLAQSADESTEVAEGCTGIHGRFHLEQFDSFDIPEICTTFMCVGDNKFEMKDSCYQRWREAPPEVYEKEIDEIIDKTKQGTACQSYY